MSKSGMMERAVRSWPTGLAPSQSGRSSEGLAEAPATVAKSKELQQSSMLGLTKSSRLLERRKEFHHILKNPNKPYLCKMRNICRYSARKDSLSFKWRNSQAGLSATCLTHTQPAGQSNPLASNTPGTGPVPFDLWFSLCQPPKDPRPLLLHT